MRIFLFEYLCSGALADVDLPASLAREGAAMRDALAADFAALPGVEVVATCDPRVAPPPVGTAIPAATPSAERELFARCCRDCDAVYVLAPELNGLLLERCRLAGELNRRTLNCRLPAIDLCGDKLALGQRLASAGIPTLPTLPCRSEDDLARLPADWWSGGSGQVVLKPRHGAGSQAISVCRSAAEATARLAEFDAGSPFGQAIVQPFLPGRPISVAALCDEAGRLACLFPIAEQRLSTDGRLSYLGGAIPARDVDRETVRDVVGRVIELIPGLCGYVGFDLLIVPGAELPLLVEINPRLTTSYVGYHRLTATNLAGGLLDPASLPPIDWNAGRVAFTPAGEVTADG